MKIRYLIFVFINIIFLIIVVNLTSCSQPKKIVKNDYVHQEISRSNKVLKEYRYYENGSLEMEIFTPSYDTITESIDSIPFETTVIEVLTGKFKKYHQNSNIKTKGRYLKGEKTGIWKSYDENGKLLKRKKYPIDN